MKYNFIIIWKNNKTKEIYYKKYKGFSLYKYEIGQQNSYGHEVLLIIDLKPLYYRISLKQRIIKKTIRFLERFVKEIGS